MTSTIRSSPRQGQSQLPIFDDMANCDDSDKQEFETSFTLRLHGGAHTSCCCLRKDEESTATLLLEGFDNHTQHLLKVAASLGQYLSIPLLEEYFKQFISNGTRTSRSVNDILHNLVKHDIFLREIVPQATKTRKSATSSSTSKSATMQQASEGDELSFSSSSW